MIICKQSRNPEDDAQGALAAARQFNPKAQPPVLGNITLSRVATAVSFQNLQPSDLTGENFEFLINKYNYGKITWEGQSTSVSRKKRERTASLDYVMFSPKGFTYVDDASWTVNQRKRFETSPNLREDFLVKTDDEVRMAVFDKISILQDPVQGILHILFKIINSNDANCKTKLLLLTSSQFSLKLFDILLIAVVGSERGFFLGL